MIRILIVDDQNLVQQGIKSLLDRDMDFKVVGTVKDGRNAIQKIVQIHPDIVLLDIEMPEMDGITATKYINRVSPKTKVIILSSHEEKKYVTRALMAGARGYLLKTSLMTDLKQAILAVNNGYSQIDSKLLAKVFDPQNVKSRKSDLEKKDNAVIQDDLTDQNSPKFLSSKNSSAKKVDTDEPVILEFDTPIKSKTIVPSEQAAWKSQEQTFSDGTPDSVVLKQVHPKDEKTKSNGHEEKSPYIFSQNTFTTFKQESTQEQHKRDNLDLLVQQNTSSKVSRVEKLLNNPKINQLKSQLKHSKTKLLSLIQHKRKQDLFRNIVLVIFGILLVVILGS